MPTRSLPFAFLILFLVSSSGSPSQRPRVTGFFSDFRYGGESGDVNGAEILISYALICIKQKKRHYAYVQTAEWGPLQPQFVPDTGDGSRITCRPVGP